MILISSRFSFTIAARPSLQSAPRQRRPPPARPFAVQEHRRAAPRARPDQSAPHSGPPCRSALATVLVRAQWTPTTTSKTTRCHLNDIWFGLSRPTHYHSSSNQTNARSDLLRDKHLSQHGYRSLLVHMRFHCIFCKGKFFFSTLGPHEIVL